MTNLDDKLDIIIVRLQEAAKECETTPAFSANQKWMQYYIEDMTFLAHILNALLPSSNPHKAEMH